MFKGKKVLVTGSDGMIGQELLELLDKEGAIVHQADFKRGIDLRNFRECLTMCKGIDYVFHLAGVKGSPRMTKEKPASFMSPMLSFDSNMIEAAQQCKVKRFLYTSSIAVENIITDKFPAWAKMSGETLIEAMRIQYPKGTKYCIVRPANVYGRFDNFQNPDAMVITSLIQKGLKKKEIEVWGTGYEERDFINAKDVARGMIQAMVQMHDKPVNLCSGKGYLIGYIATLIGEELNKEVKFNGESTGDKRRVMELNWNFKPEIDIKDGIKEVIQWKLNQ